MTTKTEERNLLGNTSIPSQLGINLHDNYGMIWNETRSADIYRVLFQSIADTLKFHETKDAKRIGMSIKDDKGHMKLGAILNYIEPEEGSEDDSGNWYLEMTFNPEDMKDLDVDIDNHTEIFIQCAAKNLFEIASGRFRSTEIMFNVFTTAIDTLVDYLNTTVEANGEAEVSLMGVFTASAAIEDGQKIISIVPGEVIKQGIKNDALL